MQLCPMTLKLLGASLIIHAVDVFSWLKQITLQYLFSLLRRGLHEVSSERKVSAQGVMGRAK
jgi:hypothetical protein